MPPAKTGRLSAAGVAMTAWCARAARGLADRRGWRAWLIALASGLLAATALPPLGLVPAVFIALTALVWQIDGTSGWRGALTLGWWFGLGHFLAGTYWISNALLVEADRFWWMIPFATLGLSAYLALYPAAACAFARLLRPGPARIAGLALAWTAMELLRAMALTGFPWNPIGSIWAGIPAMIQPAALFGVFGLSLCTVALAAAPALLARGRGAARAVLIGIPLALAVAWAGGAARLAGADDASVPGMRLAVVQPSIAQRDKIDARLRSRNFARHVRMTARRVRPGTTLVIWPETAIGLPISRAPSLTRAIAEVIPDGGHLIAGAIRATPPGVVPFRVWNSLHAFDRRAQVVASYDKAHLVPFGEYIPLRSILGFAKVTAGRMDFSAGPGPRTLEVPGIPPFGALICYEVIFPGAVAAPGRRPAWLLNVTNDGWFGASAGPHQHFAAARLRAVEEGLPVVRVANSGISGVIDAYGRVRASLGIGRAGVLEAALPMRLPAPPPFARLSNLPVAAVSILGILALFLYARPTAGSRQAAGTESR